MELGHGRGDTVPQGSEACVMRLILVNGNRCKLVSSGVTEPSCGSQGGEVCQRVLTGTASRQERDLCSPPFTHPSAPPSATA